MQNRGEFGSEVEFMPWAKDEHEALCKVIDLYITHAPTLEIPKLISITEIPSLWSRIKKLFKK